MKGAADRNMITVTAAMAASAAEMTIVVTAAVTAVSAAEAEMTIAAKEAAEMTPAQVLSALQRRSTR
jgi:hypothetical protein